MSDKRPSRKGARKSLASSEEQPRRNGSDDSSSSTEQQGENSSTESSGLESRSSSFSTVRQIDAGSSSEQPRRSEISPQSLQEEEMDTGSSSTPQVRKETTLPSVQGRKRDIPQSSPPDSKRQILEVGSSSTQSTLPQISSAGTEQQRNVAGSSSENPMPSTSLSSTDQQRNVAGSSSEQAWAYQFAYVVVRGRYERIIHTSSSEIPSPERQRNEEDGSRDQSMRSISMPESPERLIQVPRSWSDNPMLSTSFSARKERGGQPSSPEESSSSLGGETESSNLSNAPSRRGSTDATSSGDLLLLTTPEIRENIFSRLDLSDIMKLFKLSTKWNHIMKASKEAWLKICKKYGFVYTASEGDESDPYRYRTFVLKLAARLLPKESPPGFRTADVGCRYRRAYPTFDYYITIKAFHYFNKMLALVSYQTNKFFFFVRVFDMREDRPRRISKIKPVDDIANCDIFSVKLTILEGRTHVVCLTDNGFLCIWDIEDPTTQQGDRIKRDRRRHGYNRGRLTRKLNLWNKDLGEGDKPVCFDLLQGTNLIVAYGKKGSAAIRNVFGTEIVNVRTNGWDLIAKVLLVKDCSPEQSSGSDEAKMEVKGKKPAFASPKLLPKLLLFSQDSETVYMHKVRMDLSAANDVSGPDISLEVPPAEYPPIHDYLKFCYRPTLCFDGETNYLYFPDSSYHNRTNIIRQYNVETREYGPNIITQDPVDQVLAVGEKYLAYTTRNQPSTTVTLCIINKRTRFEIVRTVLPSDDFAIQKVHTYHPRHESSVIGERKWLDGLDGSNDIGVICCYQAGFRRMAFLKWTRRPA